MTKRNDPFVIPASDLPDPDATGPAEAPAPPEEEIAGGAAMQTVIRSAAGRKTSGWARLTWWLFGLFLSLVISIAAYEYVTSLIARYPALGMLVTGLMAVLALAVLLQIIREVLAYRRLNVIDQFRKDAKTAVSEGDLRAATNVSVRIEEFYAGRADIAWGARSLKEQRSGIHDADAVITLTERTLFANPDTEARREIEAACRTVAGATALIPLALADVLAALSMNIRMIRRIADIYGARSGFFGSLRLLRTVVTHLIATGLVAVGDDMIGSVAGGGALAKVSRRFGEGVINGALTARVGIAAMEVCRPLPFDALPRPRVSSLLSRALAGLFPQKAD